MKKIILTICSLLLIITAFAQAPASDLFQSVSEIIFKFQAVNKEQINELSRHISIDKVQGEEVTAYANPKEFEYFLSLNIPYEIVEKPVLSPEEQNMKDFPAIQLLRTKSAEANAWNYYPTYDAYLSLMAEFEANYPELCKILEFGQSVQGRKLLACKLSKNVNIREAEPQFLWSSSMHGDETTGYALMLRLIDYLLSNYESNPRIAALLDSMEIWIVPLANPDGTYHYGNQTVAGSIRYNANLVDLNRNYKDWRYGNHPDGEAWQPETNAFMTFQGGQSFAMGTNIHGGSEVCNYPWDNTSTRHPDTDWWKYVCKEYADTAKFYGGANYLSAVTSSGVTNGYDWYQVTGSRQDYANYYNKCKEFTLEISNTKNPPASQLPNFWNYNYRSFLNYMEQCLFGIQGVVTDSLTREPISADIIISNHDNNNSYAQTNVHTGYYVRPIKAGTYQVTYSSSGYDSQTHSISVTDKQKTVRNVALIPAIPPIVDFEADVTQIEEGESVTFSELSQFAQSLQWTFEGGNPPASTEKNPSILYETPGTYNVTLTAANSHGSNEAIKNSYITVAEKMPNGQALIVSPKEILLIKDGANYRIYAAEKIETVELINLSGQRVNRFYTYGKSIFSFSTVGLARGMYLVKITTANGIKILKLSN
jgi:hypothetical protein